MKEQLISFGDRLMPELLKITWIVVAFVIGVNKY